MTLLPRLRASAKMWDVSLDENIIETRSSLIAFGTRADQRVALKLLKRRGDEWRSGEVIRAFGGLGMVHALEVDDGAILLERAVPGTSLVEVVGAGDDDRATTIIAGIMRGFSPGAPPATTSTVEEWGQSFSRYRASGDTQLPTDLVTTAETLYDELCTSQTDRRLLHGDLQHANILIDDDRGWIAIDPKGVIGEPEVEVGPFLRNPATMPHLFDRRAVVERRLRLLCDAAGLRYARALRWGFALAVMSAIWTVEDDGVVQDDNPALTVAGALRPAIAGIGP